MHKIIFEDWQDEGCSDGCCGGDWGTRLIINDKVILEDTYMNKEDLGEVLRALGVDAEIQDSVSETV